MTTSVSHPGGPEPVAPLHRGRAPGLAARMRALGARPGWRRLLAAMVAGALAAAAMPPFGLWPVLALSFPALILLLDGACAQGALPSRLRAAAAIGWGYGFGYFLASLWWIGSAFLVDAAAFGWLLPFAVVAMPAGLALFTACGGALAALLWSAGWQRLFALTFAFTLLELVRGTVLTGFPWNSFGYAFAQSGLLMQGAALLGVHGLSFLALLVFSTPVLLLDGERGLIRWGGPVLALLLLATAAGWGAFRLQATPTHFVPGVHLRLMQPALAQDQKFNYGRSREILQDYLALSTMPTATYPQGLADVNVLIWPESAFPFIYERESWAAEMIAQDLPENVTLVTGAIRYGEPPAGQRSPYFNSIRVIDHKGHVLVSTDKVHLVPFGEYLPFQNMLESLGLEQLTRVRGGFSSGRALRVLDVPGLPPVAPLVCYEVIFPGAVVPQGPRPQLMLNLTNDAWFGETPGPYQHFAQARMRAIEEGLPLIRAANSGISAIIDPLGRIVALAPLGARTLVDGPLPEALKTQPFAAAHMYKIAVALLLFGLILSRLRLSAHVTRKS